MNSPNDQDPPDYVTGDTDEEAFYEKVYEKFPWLQDVDEMLSDDATYSGEPNGGVEEMLAFVVNEAIRYGIQTAAQDAGEYIQHLENEMAQAEALAKKTTKTLNDVVKEWGELWGWSSPGEMT